ncbi:MAG TPA: hypothetical protein PLV47_03365 [Flavobacterium sp.]|nr:hypothetical protein [Flavobacterium sp.]MBP7317557.1 hypothetical protein [Flavobacterium sp.]HRL70429.1 hypothetical protein [Flavobacterium sp.]HRM12007.1 hypothetical protein [Flavobacterium sp.]HRN43642.1 hypothetical protein [Flavobacterium sp.]
MNVSISALAWVFGGFETFKYVLVIFGFCISILIKEVNAKNEYLFYYNNGISKMQLFVYGFLLNFVFSLVLILVINVVLKFV